SRLADLGPGRTTCRDALRPPGLAREPRLLDEPHVRPADAGLPHPHLLRRGTATWTEVRAAGAAEAHGTSRPPADLPGGAANARGDGGLAARVADRRFLRRATARGHRVSGRDLRQALSRRSDAQ